MTDTIEAFRANTDLITRPELTAIFGETMPVEVFQALTVEGATLAETRNAVADIAAAQPDTGDLTALREALEAIKAMGPSGGGSGGGYRAVCIATDALAALSKPNAPEPKP